MKYIKHLVVIFIASLLTSCSMVSDPVKKIGLGSRVINYQADDTVDSLVIPPDLTKPSSQGLFIENVGVTDESYEVTEVQNVEVKRDTLRRWLLVDMPPNEVWLLSKDFFNEFVIQTDISVSKINSFLLENGIEGGIDISADGKNLIMLAVTELNSPSNIEETLNLLGGLSE